MEYGQSDSLLYSCDCVALTFACKSVSFSIDVLSVSYSVSWQSAVLRNVKELLYNHRHLVHISNWLLVSNHTAHCVVFVVFPAASFSGSAKYLTKQKLQISVAVQCYSDKRNNACALLSYTMNQPPYCCSCFDQLQNYFTGRLSSICAVRHLRQQCRPQSNEWSRSKAHSNINRKMENSTSCKIVTPKISFWNLVHVITSTRSPTTQFLMQIAW